MSNTNTYLVNNIGHWQGLEELLNTVHENQETINEDINNGFTATGEKLDTINTTLLQVDQSVNVWNIENYSRTDIFLLNSSGTTTDKIRYDVVRDTQYQDFQTAHEGDNIQFDEIIQLSTIVTNSFAVSDLFIYHAKINDEPAAKYYLVDIVMTE